MPLGPGAATVSASRRSGATPTAKKYLSGLSLPRSAAYRNSGSQSASPRGPPREQEIASGSIRTQRHCTISDRSIPDDPRASAGKIAQKAKRLAIRIWERQARSPTPAISTRILAASVPYKDPTQPHEKRGSSERTSLQRGLRFQATPVGPLFDRMLFAKHVNRLLPRELAPQRPCRETMRRRTEPLPPTAATTPGCRSDTTSSRMRTPTANRSVC